MQHGPWAPDRQIGTSALAVRPTVRAAEYVVHRAPEILDGEPSEAIRAYAARRGMEIVRTYADAGKSGLRLDGRDALKRLLEDVEDGTKDFEAILVYDISHWGRFQDADESAYYEYRCKRADISVQYCAEQFENDGSPVSTIVKGVSLLAWQMKRNNCDFSIDGFKAMCRACGNGDEVPLRKISFIPALDCRAREIRRISPRLVH